MNTIQGLNLNSLDIPDPTAPVTTPEALHRAAAALLEQAAIHHRNAALFHSYGYAKEADLHANFAHLSAARAMADSANALKLARL